MKINESDWPVEVEKVENHQRLKKITRVIAVCVVLGSLTLIGLLLFSFSRGAEAQQTNSNSDSPQSLACEHLKEGDICPLQGARACEVGRCRGLVCKREQVPAGTSCDTNPNDCTIARCSASGQCVQQNRADGTECSDATPGCSGRQSCTGGQCLPPPGAGDPSQVARVSVAEVQVAARQRRVRQATAYNDCCAGLFGFSEGCEAQYLEALVPTNGTPTPREADGRLPLRRKFCGTVTSYAVNDEKKDPRDFNINIQPAAGTAYSDFLRGFVRTDETKLNSANGLDRFANVNCNTQDCFTAASPSRIKGKVIHAEVSPDQSFYGADGRFLPIASGCPMFSSSNCTKCISYDPDCESELEGRAGEEACVYGVFAYDHGDHEPSSHTRLCCVKDEDDNHDIPEIHPFDAIWWRHPARNGWIFGVFQDDSNRYSFPHCRESESNGNTWSQAPRDLTFEFPFRFPRRSAVQRACLRHVRTTKLVDGTPNIVRPLNVTTGAFADPQSEVTTLILGRQRLLEVVKEPGSERETHVRVEGWFEGDDVVGRIVLRVAIGCDERTQPCVRPTGPRDHREPIFDRLSPTSSLVRFDRDDPGAGYFYAELTFNCNCQ